MIPARDFAYNEKKLDATFQMSNVVPQLPEVNRGAMKEVENLCRIYAIKHNKVIVSTRVNYKRTSQVYPIIIKIEGFDKYCYIPEIDSVIHWYIPFDKDTFFIKEEK
jgi:DNA/RNA endonuclease G (NUC1)